MIDQSTKLKVGMGATHCVGSDRYPYTIVEVKSNLRIIVQEDRSQKVNSSGPYTESQEWDFTPNPDADKIIVTKRKDGHWYQQGDTMGGCQFALGIRSRYNNPHY